MNVLILFEQSGRVRESFNKKGHNAISIDLEDTHIPGKHIKMDIAALTYEYMKDFDLMIMFPPCTYFSSCNRYLNKKDSNRIIQRDKDLQLIKYLWNSPIEKIAMENPATGSLKHLFIPMSQDIQPYQFGESYAKNTGLWLKNLPPLISTHINMNYQKNWVEKTKKENRIITPYGLAAAMAEQWG